MVTNTVKQKLLRGELGLGVECALGLPLLAEVLARQGFDWVHVDGQHGSWHRQTFAQAFTAVRAGGATPIARAPHNDYYAIGQLLDEGALGIIVPLVHTAEEAERAQHACRLPPQGGRSMGFLGAAALGSDYLDRINDEVLLAVQIESAAGVENAEAIMAVEGIDACWIGPWDLSKSIGHLPNTPQHDEAVRHVFQACKQHGKAPGISAGYVEYARKWIDEGGLFVSVGRDLAYVTQGSAAEARAFGREPDWPER